MMSTRRSFLKLGASGLTAAAAAAAATGTVAVGQAAAGQAANVPVQGRRFPFVQVDVFTSRRLEGNPLVVFPDARGLTGAEMQDIARETNLQDTAFVLPRDAAIERTQGMQVRIFDTAQEVPFAGHPALGAAMVIRNTRPGGAARREVLLDLQVGRVPVVFRRDATGAEYGEMHQVNPTFGRAHGRDEVARLIGVKADQISNVAPIETVSTGLPFAIVVLDSLATLQTLKPDMPAVQAYFLSEAKLTTFYYVTRDTRDPAITLAARGIFPDGEDPATGSAAGCAVAWMVRHGLAKPAQQITLRQGVEIHRPSRLIAQAGRNGDRIVDVRVGGNAVVVASGEYVL